MKRIVRSEAFIIGVFVGIILLLNASVWIVKVARTPVGREFIPIHNSLGDYPFYVSIVRQGLDGQLAVMDRYVLEPHEGSVVHLLYLMLGWAGRILHIPSAHVVYHAGRYLFGAMWAIAIYWLVSSIEKRTWVRVVATFFALTSASFPRFFFGESGVYTQWFMSWWSELDPIERAAFVPHFTVGHILMVAAIVFLMRYGAKHQKRWLVRGAVASFLAAFIHPPSAIQVMMIVPAAWVIYRARRWFIGGMVVIFGGAVGLVLIDRVSSRFPWSLALRYESVQFAVPLWEFLLALGPIVVLAMTGVISQRRHRDTWLLVAWIATALVMVPVAKTMPFSPFAFVREHAISNIRFLQTALWVPLAILGAWGLAEIWARWGRGAGIVTIAVWVGLTFVGYPSALHRQIAHMYFSSNYTYPVRGYIEGIRALKEVTRDNEGILALSLTGYTIPMYINRPVFLRRIVSAPDREIMMTRAWQFFHGDMSACEAFRFLKTNRIGAVLYSFDEKNAGDAVKFYSFLQPWNTYGETTVYTVVDAAPPGC